MSTSATTLSRDPSLRSSRRVWFHEASGEPTQAVSTSTGQAAQGEARGKRRDEELKASGVGRVEERRRGELTKVDPARTENEDIEAGGHRAN